MKEFEGDSFKYRVARLVNNLGWSCINLSYRMFKNGVQLDNETEDTILRRAAMAEYCPTSGRGEVCDGSTDSID